MSRKKKVVPHRTVILSIRLTEMEWEKLQEQLKERNADKSADGSANKSAGGSDWESPSARGGAKELNLSQYIRERLVGSNRKRDLKGIRLGLEKTETELQQIHLYLVRGIQPGEEGKSQLLEELFLSVRQEFAHLNRQLQNRLPEEEVEK